MSMFHEFNRMQRQMDAMMNAMNRHFATIAPGFEEDWHDMDMGTTGNASNLLTSGGQQASTAAGGDVAGKGMRDGEKSQLTTTTPSTGSGHQQLATTGRGVGTQGGMLGPLRSMSGGMLSAPAVDVIAHPTKYVIHADLPAGITKEDVKLDIDTHRGVLSLSGQHVEKHEEKGEQGEWIRRERRSGMFQRSLRLPNDVDLNALGNNLARYNNGVLELELPRKQQTVDPTQTQTRRQIQIQ